MDALQYIADKFGLDLDQEKMPIEILKINRKIMAETLGELGMNLGVEVGTAAGEHAETLCMANPNLKLCCVDPWEHYHGYTDYLSAKLTAFYEIAVKRLAPYGCTLVRKYSLDAARDFQDQSLDFVYIDGNHDFLHVTQDIYAWLPKIRSGGVIFGHDFKRSKNPLFMCHVMDVVLGYTYALRVRPWFVLGEPGPSNGQYREGTRGWMWVIP